MNWSPEPFLHPVQQKRCFYGCLRAQASTNDSALRSDSSFLDAGIPSVSDVKNRRAAHHALLSFRSRRQTDNIAASPVLNAGSANCIR